MRGGDAVCVQIALSRTVERGVFLCPAPTTVAGLIRADGRVRGRIQGLVGYFVFCLFAMAGCGTQARSDATIHPLDIAREELTQALSELSVQSGSPILYRYDISPGVLVGPLVGDYSIEEALALLLEGKPFYFTRSANGFFVVHAVSENTGQESEDPQVDEDDEGLAAVPGTTIDEVVVFARKKYELLQETPLAVTSLSQDFINHHAVYSSAEIHKYIPNTHFEIMQLAGGALTSSIRGISYDQVEKANEPPVGVSVDGIFFASNSGALVDIFDIESVEVLRGPQGTLFGRNTMGGTVNIQRTRPSREFNGKLALDAGSYGRRDAKMLLRGPLIESRLAGKLGYYNIRGDSHTRRQNTGKRDKGPDREAAIASLLWTPTDTVDVQFNADYLEDHSHYPGMLGLTRPGELLCDSYGICARDSYDIARKKGFSRSFGSQPLVNRMRGQTYSVTANWSRGALGVTSITGYNRLKEYMIVENTGAPDPYGVPALVAERWQSQEQFSQELRLASDYEGPFNFVAGLYHFEVDYDLLVDTYFLGSLMGTSLQGQRMSAQAIFGEMTYNLTEKTRLTLGGRYSYEKKKLTVVNAASSSFACPDPDAPPEARFCRKPVIDFDDTTFRSGIDHSLSDDLMVYFMWSQGFKSGGWVARTQSQESVVPYDPETLDSFELGIRSEWLDRRLRLNAMAFHMRYGNKQEAIHRQSPNTLVVETITVNGSSARINGLELEIQALLTPSLSLNVGIGYLDARYKEFLDKDGIDIKDRRHYNFAPQWNVNLGGLFIHGLDAVPGEVVLAANYKWTDDYTTDPIKDPLGFGREVIGSYGQFDLSLSYGHFLPGDRALRVAVFVNDAFHRDGRLSRVSNAGSFVFGDMVPGRTWGVSLSYEIKG